MGNKGFTLFEVLIALVIMTLAFTSILQVQSNSINASARAKQINIVAMLAKRMMIQTEHKIEGKTFEETKKEEAGQFESPYEDYRWKMEIKEIKFPIFDFLGAKSNPEKNSNSDQGSNQYAALMVKYFFNFLSKSMREVRVSVFWKRGSGEQSFTLATYWVDLNREFELSDQ